MEGHIAGLSQFSSREDSASNPFFIQTGGNKLLGSVECSN